jgi:hypothetical protein
MVTLRGPLARPEEESMKLDPLADDGHGLTVTTMLRERERL